MKDLRFTILSLIFIFAINCSVFGQETNKQSLIRAKEILSYIQTNEADSIISRLDESAIKQGVPRERIEEFVNIGQGILNDYIAPSDSEVQFSEQILTTVLDNKKYKIDNYSFPFTSKENDNQKKYFLISVLDNGKIIKIFISDNVLGQKIIEPPYSEPHLEKFDFNFKDLQWFRIWYNNGYKEDKKIKGRNYYAVSGGLFKTNESDDPAWKQITQTIDSISNSKEISSLEKERTLSYLKEVYKLQENRRMSLTNERSIKDRKIKKLFTELFDCINTAKVDTTDYKYLRENNKGNSESIYIRMKFNNSLNYQNLGEFSISCILDADPSLDEDMSEYIIIKHSEKTRYLLLKRENPKLLLALRKIANYNYKKYYEENP